MSDAEVRFRVKVERKELMENTAAAQGTTLAHLIRESFAAFWFDWVPTANRILIEGGDLEKEWEAFRLRHPDFEMPLRRR